jgi:serine/threonine protein phosphatase 1
VGQHDSNARIFAVGDIHGQNGKLADLLGFLPFHPGRDRLVFLGDYINRGPDSQGVIRSLIALKERVPDAIFLMGNHEEALLRYARDGDLQGLRLLRSMGVEATLDSYGGVPAARLRHLAFMPAEHRDFLYSLGHFLRLGDYLFVHAGLPPGAAPEDCPPDSLMSCGGLFLREPSPPGTTIVFGHTASLTPLAAPGKIGVDTGAAYGGPLTAVELPSGRLHHA